MSILFYRRPSYVDRPAGPLNVEDCQKYVERTKNNRHNIPSQLSFDNVISNKSLPVCRFNLLCPLMPQRLKATQPCTLQDFMDYLVYVAHDAETLQFYLWLQDYTKRFNALKSLERGLSPEWKAEEADEKPTDRRVTKVAPQGVPMDFDDLDKKNGSSIHMSELASPTKLGFDFDEPPMSPSATISDYESFISKSVRSQKSIVELAEDANAQAGLKWQGFTVQPFRSEIAKVVAHYFAPGAPRELNLSHRDKTAVLHALQHTTHPSAFSIANTVVEGTLRGQLHPNFVRWSICNGNKPKIFFVRFMGISHTFAGILIALLLTLSRASRWWRIAPALITLIGLVTLVAAYKGLCVILHASGKVRNLKPWEDIDSVYSGDTEALTAASIANRSFRDDDTTTLATSDAASFQKSVNAGSTASIRGDNKSLRRPRSFETFGSSNGTYKEDAWVSRYEKKPVLRKVFENNTWVQEEAIRLIQDKIVMQSQIWGLSLTLAITAAFVACPKGNFY
jgi:hypothetical protein